MTKQNTASKKKKKKVTSLPKKNTTSKKKLVEIKKEKRKYSLMISVIFLLGVLLIFSAYAWFSTALNVKIKTFNMIVTKNSGLTISFDAITYDSFVEISRQTLIDELKKTYPNNLSQWASNGLTPVSSIGITNKNNYFFDVYATGGVRYRTKEQINGYVVSHLSKETKIAAYNNYLAFDLFLRNDTGSPISDNLYLDHGTEVVITSEASEEMVGLVNSIRIGFVKVGSVPLNTDPSTIQNLKCNNDCKSIIYEPNSKFHTNLSLERALKYGVNLIDGERFPTYAFIKQGGPITVSDTVSGSANLDTNYFGLQNTINEDDFDDPIFSIPNGVTKVRVYVWIEGQDIDSLETDSEGAEISISINFVKDTQGYTSFD